MSKFDAPSRFKMGNNAHVDSKVELGYLPEKIKDLKPLMIGHSARIRSGTVIYAATRIGDHLETGHNVVIREDNSIGDHFCIWNNSVIDYGCKIANGVKIHCSCYIAQFTTIEDDVFLAPGVTIANDLHPGCDYSKKCMEGPLIKRAARIGVNVTILPFVTIGENSLVGGGSVVTKDIPADSVAYGNPARLADNIYNLNCRRGLTDRPYHNKECQQ